MSLRYFSIVLLAVICTATLSAQTDQSIHQLESERHAGVDSGQETARPILQRNWPPALPRKVFGWLPYWIAPGLWSTFDLGALSSLAWFSYEVDPLTGTYKTLHGWPAPELRDAVHTAGVRYILTVTNFGYDNNDSILGSPERRTTLASSIATVVKNGGGDGVNIDFESVRGAQRDNLVLFMRELADRVRAQVPGAEISMAIPAVDWSGAFYPPALASICDVLIMMGYDYHWSSAPTAGPVAPLAGETYNVTRSLETWLSGGIPPEKLLLGVPWYGYEWPVVDSSRGAATLGRAFAVLYSTVAEPAPGFEHFFDTPTSSPWYRYRLDSTWRQAWYDDSTSLALKYVLVTSMDLAGIGIWALGYEGGRPELWQGIRQSLGSSRVASEVVPPSALSLRMDGRRVIARAAGRGASIELVSALGEVVLQRRLRGSEEILDLDVLQIAHGRYFVRLRDAGAVALLPIVL